MTKEYFVKPLSNAAIEEKAYAWREALEVPAFCQAPDIVDIIENVMPQLDSAFGLIVEPSTELDNIEAYTEFSPPRIVVRQNVYLAARNYDGRARWTFAHELGHLVLHDTAVPLHRAPVKYRKMDELPAYASTEKQADKFAAYFLMPTWIIDEFGTAQELSAACKVSFQAADIRLQKHGKKPRKELPIEVQEYLRRGNQRVQLGREP